MSPVEKIQTFKTCEIHNTPDPTSHTLTNEIIT